jgi:hypothetical protein
MKHSRDAFPYPLLRAGIVLLFALAIAQPAVAQDNTKTQMPGPEHQKLGFLVGTWKIERTYKKNPYQPVEEKRACTLTGEWLEGNFWVVGRYKEPLPTDPYSELLVYGYDSETKTYSCHVFTSTGNLATLTGPATGNTWTFLGDSKEGGKSHKARWTIVEESPTTGRDKIEVSEDGGPWVLISESKWTKM